MAFDLKPLTNEIIHKMEYSTHDLWIVKLDEEVFGPFEVESLKHYATENEKLFEHALASRMDTTEWQPFFTYSHFHPIADHPHFESQTIEKFWILHLGQKVGPYSPNDIHKKMKLGFLTVTDLVSIDDGHTWIKFFNLEVFNSQEGGVESLPITPLNFQKAKEELIEWMDSIERKGSHLGMAALTYMGQHKDKDKNKAGLKLEEMDLKSLRQTEVSRSLKWAIPCAVAGLIVCVMVGSYIFSPSTSDTAEIGDDNSESLSSVAANPTDKNAARNNRRKPASHQPLNPRSALTSAPTMNHNDYQPQVETHYNEPDPADQMFANDQNSGDQNPPPEPQEHSIVNNTQPNETLDQAMGGAEPEPPAEQPVVEEISDF